MRGHAGIAFVQSMGRRLADKSAADPLLQFILLAVGRQQIPQLHPVIAEQTKVQLAEGRDPQPVATGTEILAVGHDEPYPAHRLRVHEHLGGAIVGTAQLLQPTGIEQTLLDERPAGVMIAKQDRKSVV